LNRKRPHALPYNGKNVLVVGLGPAGYTLAHHLLNDGFCVVAIDGLKIEPLAPELVGDDERAPRPILDSRELFRPLDERTLSGFGGVSEYGITVRWDKSFLDLLHLNLARRRTLAIHGGVRFGGTLTIEQAFDLGFHHVALAAGAGRPTLVEMKNNLIRGVRKASDFLMALQLTGAFKSESLANLHLELPVLVIGGGLTAIDTATESLAYYAIHVEQLLHRFERLTREKGEAAVLAELSVEEKMALGRHLEHGRAIRSERRRAEKAGETPDFARLCKLWGGSAIVYRKTMEESPAYRLNHEEVAKALEEGISFLENLEPLAAVPDDSGALKAVIFRRKDGSDVELPCRTLLVAAGTSPNITYEKELPGSLPLDGRKKFFLPHVAVPEEGATSVFRLVPKEDGVGAFFTGAQYKGKLVTYFGDNHPVYAGSVVKAMASAKNGAPRIREIFAAELDAFEALSHEDREAGQLDRERSLTDFTRELDRLLTPRIVRVDRLTPTIVEIIVEAPLAARNFEPGQFYRFQNYESSARRLAESAGEKASPLTLEPCALTGAWVDKEQGLLSLIALELGVSSRLCAMLKPGERVVVMGPTGAPTHIPEDEVIVLCGGGLGNAVLFSIGKAARERGNRVLYFAGYKKAEDFYKRDQIEAGADVVVYSVDTPPIISKRRPGDFDFLGNIVQAMLAYAEGRLGKTTIPLSAASRLIAIGSDRMMAAVAAARHGVLAPHLSPAHIGIGSINSPMQCMMKEVCAQCLQRHVDPVTRKESFVFSCFNQDQKLDEMDWGHLRTRLGQNTLEEKISSMWLSTLLSANAPQRR
jgi:NADPH-dependent glutamate synthase beta subunit-like oxidoreductase/NAD(P)H-flavin reductase